MIKSQLGTVQLTKPNYELAKKLEMTPEDIDIVTEVGLRTDLTAILCALVERYGINKALDMWYDAVKVYVEAQKGDNNT